MAFGTEGIRTELLLNAVQAMRMAGSPIKSMHSLLRAPPSTRMDVFNYALAWAVGRLAKLPGPFPPRIYDCANQVVFAAFAARDGVILHSDEMVKRGVSLSRERGTDIAYYVIRETDCRPSDDAPFEIPLSVQVAGRAVLDVPSYAGVDWRSLDESPLILVKRWATDVFSRRRVSSAV